MKVLFIGGTGLISTACSQLACSQGIELFLLNRGNRTHGVVGATHLVADIRDHAQTAQVLAGHHFDAVVNWIADTPNDIERDLELFHDCTNQYVFISSASAYQRSVRSYRMSEDTPLANPYWEYSRNNIARCGSDAKHPCDPRQVIALTARCLISADTCCQSPTCTGPLKLPRNLLMSPVFSAGIVVPQWSVYGRSVQRGAMEQPSTAAG